MTSHWCGCRGPSGGDFALPGSDPPQEGRDGLGFQLFVKTPQLVTQLESVTNIKYCLLKETHMLRGRAPRTKPVEIPKSLVCHTNKMEAQRQYWCDRCTGLVNKEQTLNYIFSFIQKKISIFLSKAMTMGHMGFSGNTD